MTRRAPRSPRAVLVLMGGPSEEHQISLRSGQGVAAALAHAGWEVIAFAVPRAGVSQAAEAIRKGLAVYRPAVVFIALHGPFGEDGAVQALCEEAGVAYTGSDAAASRLGMDKVASRRAFERAGLPAPRWEILSAIPEDVAAWQARWPGPVVVKPSNQGSSVGVTLVRGPEEWLPALRLAFRFSTEVLVEEFIAGREVTAGILGETALPVVEIRPKHALFDFSAKYTAGMTNYLVPAPLPADVAAEVQRVGLAAHRVLGCRHLSRADLLVRPDGSPVLLEVNTIPGFTSTSLLPKAAACAGVSYEQLCERLVILARDGTAAPARRRHPVLAGAAA